MHRYEHKPHLPIAPQYTSLTHTCRPCSTHTHTHTRKANTTRPSCAVSFCNLSLALPFISRISTPPLCAAPHPPPFFPTRPPFPFWRTASGRRTRTRPALAASNARQKPSHHLPPLHPRPQPRPMIQLLLVLFHLHLHLSHRPHHPRRMKKRQGRNRTGAGTEEEDEEWG